MTSSRTIALTSSASRADEVGELAGQAGRVELVKLDKLNQVEKLGLSAVHRVEQIAVVRELQHGHLRSFPSSLVHTIQSLHLDLLLLWCSV